MKLRITPPRKPTVGLSTILAFIGVCFLFGGASTAAAIFLLAGFGFLLAGNLLPKV